MNKAIILIVLFMFSATTFAAEIIGQWKTIDDATGKPKSVVELSIVNGKLYGKIVKFFNDNPNHDPICDKCTGELHNKKIMGMQIVRGLSNEDGKWGADDGILDPENGKFYDVKMWVEGNELKVRGYIGFLYRTQTWIRYK